MPKTLKPIFYLSLILLIFSCSKNLQPEFRNITDLKIAKVNGQEIVLTGNAVIFNPAPIGHTIDSAEMQVDLEGINLGMVEQEIKTKLEPKSETILPITLKFDTNNLKGSGWMMKAIGIATSGKANIKLNGKIYISIKGAKIPLPVDFEEQIYLSDYVE